MVGVWEREGVPVTIRYRKGDDIAAAYKLTDKSARSEALNAARELQQRLLAPARHLVPREDEARDELHAWCGGRRG